MRPSTFQNVLSTCKAKWCWREVDYFAIIAKHVGDRIGSFPSRFSCALFRLHWFYSSFFRVSGGMVSYFGSSVVESRKCISLFLIRRKSLTQWNIRNIYFSGTTTQKNGIFTFLCTRPPLTQKRSSFLLEANRSCERYFSIILFNKKMPRSYRKLTSFLKT